MKWEALPVRGYAARGKFKILAMFLGVVTLLGQMARGQTDAPATGNIQVARLDVIINENGFEGMDAVDSKMIDTSSAIYQGSIFKADDLRAAINATAAAGGLEGSNQSMGFTQNGGPDMYYMPQQLYFNYYQGQDSHVGLQGNPEGNENYSKGDVGKIHVKLDYTKFNNTEFYQQVNGRRTTIPSDKKAKISYDGQFGAGDALVFSATVKTKEGTSFRHMIVWEAFQSDQRYGQKFQMIQDPQRWCQLGPAGIRKAADIAAVWAAQAKPSTPATIAKWEQKLEDGKVVRLTGITRTDKWIFCWWDGDGMPIANDDWIQFNKYSNDRPVNFSARVSGPAEEWKKQSPTGHPSGNNGQVQTGEYSEGIDASVDAAGKVEVGVAVGPWEQVGEIKKGGTVKIGSRTYTLRDVGGNTDYMYAQFYSRGGEDNDNLVTLSAVKQDGTEVDPNYMQSIKAKNYGYGQPGFQGMGPKDVKTLHVWKRKMQWVTFSGVPVEPVTPPKDDVSPADLAAAVAVQQKVQQEVQEKAVVQQMAALEGKRKDWEAIPIDPTTPKGALRALFDAANKGDLQGVRARIKSGKGGSGAMDDLVARYVTATQAARAIAISRFGEEKVQGLSFISVGGNQMPGLMDMEMQMVDISWQPRPDGGLTAEMAAVVKGDDGKYTLDISPAMNKTSGLQSAALMVMFLGRAQSMEQVNQLLKSNPSLTFEQLRQALSEPPSTTQPATTHPA